jgi:hypothetical protein
MDESFDRDDLSAALDTIAAWLLAVYGARLERISLTGGCREMWFSAKRAQAHGGSKSFDVTNGRHASVCTESRRSESRPISETVISRRMTLNDQPPEALPRGRARGDRRASTGYERLRSFLSEGMSMSHVYQPLMIRTILAGGGAATRRQIAASFLAADLSQLEYYEQITKGYPTQTLRRHGIIEHRRGIYRLSKTFQH